MSELLTVAPEPFDEARPWYWSIRRELWENRSIALAPLIAAAVALFGFLINTVRGADHPRLSALDPVRELHPAKARLKELSQLEPLNLLTAPGLWLGLAFAAGCLIAAVRLRRHREQI